MRRYWIEKKDMSASEVTFTGELFHHIFEVCRQQIGSHFEVLTEDSQAYLVKVTAIEKKQARAQVVESRPIVKLPRPHIHIALSMSRYQVMDSIIEKAVEMGVSSIQPFCSDNSFIRKPENLPAGKIERWKKIIVSATQQSGRGELMSVSEPLSWAETISRINPNSNSWCLFAYEGESAQAIQPHLQKLKSDFTSPPENVWLMVGSEGGFSAQEVLKMQQLGLHPVTLGPQVLRVETACMTLVSVLKYEFGLLQ